ncbi:MAG: NADH-quinone oxidoreductase subunit L, partial [Firmicutes bacterium]|nr:NADH-quinone oxidoreductase subunit L [Bacillota bacterium]
MTADSLAGLVWLVPLVPGLASAVLAFAGHRLPRQGDWLAVASVGLSWLLALVILFAAYAGGAAERTFIWAVFGGDPLGKEAPPLTVGYRLDGLAALMLVVVTTVSLAVHVFSTGYMAGDARYKRYFTVLSFFTFAMLGLVVADNLLALFIFWELVGFASYALIGHYFQRADARSASMKAFITTRAGDVAMLLGVLLVFRETGTFDFEAVREAVAGGLIPSTRVTLAALLLFGGAVGKSAQFPLHVWLPAAMAGPTPASALIHAATMVAAGVYLVARSYGLFFGSPEALQVMAWIGGFTALLAASMATVQDDMKRVMAYSTISQLGYMMMARGGGAYTAALFHLTTHAFFKALLFLAAGSVISATHHVQQMNRLGGLLRRMPLTAAAWMVGGAALIGIPPFSGFFSKDEILMAVRNSDVPA